MIKQFRTSIQGDTQKRLPDTDFGIFDKTRKTLVVDSGRKFQTHIGFGGAFTESSAYVLSKISPDLRSEVISAYFSEDGLKYTLGRTHINSCDFALSNYCYIEEEAKDLSSFDLSREDELVVPLIKDAKKAAGGELKLLASPWSPPPHFKDNLEMNYGGKLKPEYAALWAEYYCKYITEMQARGIDIWAVSVQNEPLASQTWDSCIYTAEEERDFIKHCLIPALKKNGLEHIKIIAWDHNRDIAVLRANVIYADPDCYTGVWGIGYHWYFQGGHGELALINALYPEKHILFTEGCVEYKLHAPESEQGKRGDWSNAEYYAKNIINDFNNYCEGWIDWNLALNSSGGPNHAGNLCEALVMVNTEENKVIYNPSFHYVAHFAKFIERGAKRVFSAHNAGDDIFVTAYSNNDGKLVVVVMNTGWIKDLALVVDKRGLNITLPGRSITTYII